MFEPQTIESQGACFCMHFWLVAAGLIRVCGRRHREIVGIRQYLIQPSRVRCDFFPKRAILLPLFVTHVRMDGASTTYSSAFVASNIVSLFPVPRKRACFWRAPLPVVKACALFYFFSGSYMFFVPDPHRTYRFDCPPILRTLFLGAAGAVPHPPLNAAVT